MQRAEPWSNGQRGRLQSGSSEVQIPPRPKIMIIHYLILSLFLRTEDSIPARIAMAAEEEKVRSWVDGWVGGSV